MVIGSCRESLAELTFDSCKTQLEDPFTPLFPEPYSGGQPSFIDYGNLRLKEISVERFGPYNEGVSSFLTKLVSRFVAGLMEAAIAMRSWRWRIQPRWR